MNRCLATIPLLAAALALAACTSPAPASQPSPAVAPAAATQSPPASPAASASCALRTTFSYIVRTTEPGQPAIAQEIGNVDLGNCTPTLSDFAQTAGQAQGECTTIARARANRGYNVNASPAPPLRKVLMRAGPGC
jgi:hypothetical protein